MKIRAFCALMVTVLFGGSLVAAAESSSPQREVTVYFSPGSSNGRGDIAPLQSAASIDEAFDASKRCFGATRIFWRGLQEEDYGRNQIFRDDNLAVADYWKLSRHNTFDLKLNRHAVRAAHMRGMSIWGYTSLFEYGAEPREAVYGAMNSGPASCEAKLRVRHPEWIPIDRHGIRRQSGPLELAYPGARKALRDELVREVLRHDYDGLMLTTYIEVSDLWFEDEFGFSEPIVREYKRRYGIDIRTQSFDLEAWRKLRGEYVTVFLKDLRDVLRRHGKKLGMAIDPSRPAFPQPWAGNPTPIANAGSLEMDWRNWLQGGVIDELMLGSLKGVEPFAAEYKASQFAPSAVAVPVSVLGHPNTPTEMLEAPLPPGWLPVVSASTPSFEVECAARGGLAPGGILQRRKRIRELAEGGPAGLAEIERSLDAAESGVRCAAALALKKVYGPQTPARLYRAVAERSDYQFASCASQALSGMSDDESPAIIAGLASSSVAVRRVAAEALEAGVLRKSSLVPLLDATRDANANVRHSAVCALARFNEPLAVDTLLVAMNDRHPTVRTAAAFVLGILFANREAGPMKTKVRRELAGRFAAFTGKYKGADAEWGWRTPGQALLNMGPEGREVLEGFLARGTDCRLADFAWRALYLPPSALTKDVRTLDQAEPFYRLHPCTSLR